MYGVLIQNYFFLTQLAFMKKRIKKRNQTRKNKCSRTKSKGGNDEIKTQNKHIRILQKCLNEFITTEEDYCKTLISAIRFTTKLQTRLV